MAEIAQNRVQESKPIKAGVTYTSPTRKAYDTPNQMVGIVPGQEQKAWTAAADAVGSLGFIGAKINEARERLIAEDIMREMAENNKMAMKTLVEQTQNTSIENLDFEGMIWGWEDRHTNDFKVGPNGKDGKPSMLVKDKALEDYDLPPTQLRELKTYYKNLEQKTSDWIFENVPIIQQKKSIFYLTRKGAKAQEEIEKIFRDTSRYEGGVDSIFSQDEEEQVVDRATGEPIIFNKTPYTNELGILAQQEVNNILSAYDVEIAKLMDTGMLNLEDAIDLQKKFSEGVLFRQFQNDKIRNPEETFLKVTKHGYAIQRDINVGRSKAQKAIMYEVSLPSTKTDAFTSSWSTRLQRESRADIKEADADAILVEGMKIEELIGTKVYLENPDNTIDEVIKLYKSVGYDSKNARSAGLTWLAKNKIHDDSISKRLANNMRSGLEQEIARNSEGLIKILSYDQGEDKMAHDQKKLSKVLLEKFGGKFVRPDGSKYTRAEEIAAVETITHGEIQTLINNKVAYDVISEMDILTTQWEGMLIDAGGRGHLAREFFDFDKVKGKFILNREKMEGHPYRKRFKSSSDMGRVLMKIQNGLNRELEGQGKIGKTDTDIGIEQQGRFTSSLQLFATDQGNTFYNQTRVPNPDEKEMEKTAMQQSLTDHINNSLWKTAKALKYSEKEFKAMDKETRRRKYLWPWQKSQLEALEQDFEDIQDALVMAYPHNKSKPAVLKLAFENMMRKNNNTYTGRAVQIVQKFLGARIQSLAKPNIWHTSITECVNAEDPLRCAVSNLNDYDVDPWKVNFVTPDIKIMGIEALNIKKKD